MHPHDAVEPAPGTVGQLVVERPSRARVFERFGIDYCCGGRKPLEQACRDRHVDPQLVLEELRKHDARRGPERDWAALGLTRLADHIEQTHHDYLRQELPRLDFLTRKVAAVHGEHHPELVRLRDVFLAFKAELLNHMQKEELVLFPLCRRLENGEAPAGLGEAWLQRPLDVLTHEHDDAGAALAEMRRLTNDFEPPADACNTYRALFDSLKELEADMHQHVHLENNVLFPAALDAWNGER
ncbi:MAG TPA: iron-sulfur cluster repair di-iron protein [Tepidisphaeraceae bacterium]|nr:iron-sulfur cluster repair di-iron protein [Tepidisphaeraceae bacterium]